MPLQINGTTIIDETLLADKNLSNLSEDGKNVIKSLASGAGGMKRPDYTNGSQQNITASGTVNGSTVNASYTSVTISKNGGVICESQKRNYTVSLSE